MNQNDKFRETFKIEKPIIGMIHLFGNTDEDIFMIAKKEIDIFIDNDVDGILVENYACKKARMLEDVLNYLKTNCCSTVYGVNYLGNYERSFELADAYNAKFIQVDSVAGHLTPSYDMMFHNAINEWRRKSNALLLGGVRFKYQPVLSERTLISDLEFGMKRCDAIVVTSEGTGIETDLQKINQFRSIIEDFPLVVGAGLTYDNCVEQLRIADGGIVGSYLKEEHVDYGEVSPIHTKKIMSKVKTIRK